MSAPWTMGESLPPEARPTFRRRAVFDGCKWDPQVGDVSVLAPAPILLSPEGWDELSTFASQLAAETLAMESELVARPDLHGALGQPRALCRAYRDVPASTAPGLRVMRFDFHWTTEGWRLSEVNSDVPGGYVEASAVASLMAGHQPGARLAGDPTAEIAAAISTLCPGGRIGLVHATAYTDDRQVMVYLGRKLREIGLEPVLMAPDHVDWCAGQPRLPASWGGLPLDFLFRFFPAEWLPNLPRHSNWECFLHHQGVPMCNPATALLSQSKRLPLVWDRLATPHPTWSRLLPETRDPRDADWRRTEDWVLKPALGRVGDMVGMRGVTRDKEWRSIMRRATWFGRHWVAQRRFDAVPAEIEGREVFPCLGVYTLGSRACGIYGRVAAKPLIDHEAQDIAVLVAGAPNHGLPATVGNRL